MKTAVRWKTRNGDMSSSPIFLLFKKWGRLRRGSRLADQKARPPPDLPKIPKTEFGEEILLSP
jgi:hypothetical protein